MSKALRTIGPVTIVALAVFLAVAVAQQDSHVARAAFTDSDGDGAIDIGEELSGSDPFDAASIPEDTGAAFLASLPLCSDGVDNDLDGLTDGDDPGCTDSDGDLVPDPIETLLASDPSDAESFPEDARLDAVLAVFDIPPLCGDGLDNDLDGLTDGDDPGCTSIDNDGDGFDDLTEKTFGSDPLDAESTPEHEVPNPGSCDDGVDNDQNGLTDSADARCYRASDNREGAGNIAALPFTDSAKIYDMTLEPDEPTPGCAFAGIESTVWYTFTPAADMLVIADTLQSNYDTIIAVWIESESGLVEVACNDDVIGTHLGIADPDFATDFRSRLPFYVDAGQKYFFQVGRYGIDEGGEFDFNTTSSLTFNLRAGTPLANDELTGATSISALPFTDDLDMSYATRDQDEPSSGCGLGTVVAATVWYAFTPTENLLVATNTLGSDFDRVLAVWTENGGRLEDVSCDNSFGREPSPVVFQAVAGQTYFIQVTQIGWFGPTGWNLAFTVTGEPVSADQGGDANCDGSVDAVDAALVLQFSAGLLSSLPCDGAADVNGDGDITSVDAALILQFVAGLIPTL